MRLCIGRLFTLDGYLRLLETSDFFLFSYIYTATFFVSIGYVVHLIIVACFQRISIIYYP